MSDTEKPAVPKPRTTFYQSLLDRIDSLEKQLGEVVDQRDQAETALSKAYKAATDVVAEWSNNFGFREAVSEIESRAGAWRATTQLACSLENERNDLKRQLQDAQAYERALLEAQLVLKLSHQLPIRVDHLRWWLNQRDKALDTINSVLGSDESSNQKSPPNPHSTVDK